MTKKESILYCFLLYTASILSFAWIYLCLHRRSSKMFLFHADIHVRQRRLMVRRSAREAARLESDAAILATVISRIPPETSVHVFPTKMTPGVLPEAIFWIESHTVVRTTGSPAYLPYVAGHYYRLLYHERSRQPRIVAQSATTEKERRSHLKWLEEAFAEKREGKAIMHKRASDARKKDIGIWRYVDFVYFSTVAQTTVGFGDILPNHPRVRLFVVIQIFLGYAIFVGILNFLLTM